MKLMKTVAFSVLALTFIGCNRNPANNEINSLNEINKEKSSLMRKTDPVVTSYQKAELVFGNTKFAIDLYRKLATGSNNIFFSPFSISMALAMTYGGAENNTAAQMKNVLQFTLCDSMVHNAFNSIDLQLSSSNDVSLSIVNQAWGRKDVRFDDDYLDLLALNYGSGMKMMDFENDPEGCRQIVNNWVELNTNGKIRNLLTENSIKPNTALILTNAVYFLGEWLNRFDEKLTSDQQFYLEDGSSVVVPMMTLGKNGEPTRLNYSQTAFCTAVELPYKGDDISMVVVLPSDSNLTGFGQMFTTEMIHEILENFDSADMYIKMPSFTFTSGSISLKTILESMGMTDAFNSQTADFSGIAGPHHPLWIDDIIHKAFIKVDEKGTEAAAATAVLINDSLSVGPGNRSFIADRPFLFMIRDKATGTVLFMGRIMNPLES